MWLLITIPYNAEGHLHQVCQSIRGRQLYLNSRMSVFRTSCWTQTKKEGWALPNKNPTFYRHSSNTEVPHSTCWSQKHHVGTSDAGEVSLEISTAWKASHASLEAHQTSRLYTTETVEGSCLKSKTHPKSTNKDNSKKKACHLRTEGFWIKCIKRQGTLTLTQSDSNTVELGGHSKV